MKGSIEPISIVAKEAMRSLTPQQSFCETRRELGRLREFSGILLDSHGKLDKEQRFDARSRLSAAKCAAAKEMIANYEAQQRIDALAKQYRPRLRLGLAVFTVCIADMPNWSFPMAKIVLDRGATPIEYIELNGVKALLDEQVHSIIGELDRYAKAIGQIRIEP